MTDQPEADRDDDNVAAARTPADQARRWLNIIERSDKTFRFWRERVRKIEKLYLSDRGDAERTASKRKMELLWSNIQTLQPAIYAKMPHPVVSRRFRDNDKVARTASELVERCLAYTFDCSNADDTFRMVRDDYLIAGRGQAWVRYEVDTDKNDLGIESIKDERVVIDYVRWDDFGHPVARFWSEVTAVWRKVYMTRDELKSRFGEEVGEAVKLDHKFESDSTSPEQTGSRDDKATVYEIWDKITRKVYFVAKAFEKCLEVADPFLDFEGFFPCPKPAYGTLVSSSLIPTPDYVFYQDQVEEIDDLTARIGYLTDALKLVGFYSTGNGEPSAAIEKALKPGFENALVPIADWGQFKEGGGTGGLIEWMPVEQVVKVIQACVELRKTLIDDIYQITGLSDILRGESDPNETATAQQIKSQWGSVRVRDRQQEIARFIRDVSRLAAEVISERFQPETLLAMSNMQLPTQAQLEQAMMQQAMVAQQQAAQQAQMPPQGAPQGMPA